MQKQFEFFIKSSQIALFSNIFLQIFLLSTAATNFNWMGEKQVWLFAIPLNFVSSNFKLVSLGPPKSGLCQPLSLLVTLLSWVALFVSFSAFWLNWHHFAFCDSGVIFCWQCLVMVTDWCPCGMGRSHWLARCINADLLNDMQTCLCAKWQLNGCPERGY